MWLNRVAVIVKHRWHGAHVSVRVNWTNHHSVLIVNRHTLGHLVAWGHRVTIHIIRWGDGLNRLHHRLWINHDRLAINVEHWLSILVKLLVWLILLLHWGHLRHDHNWLAVLVEHGHAVLVTLLHWLGLLLHWWRLLLLDWLLGVDHYWLALRVEHWLPVLV